MAGKVRDENAQILVSELFGGEGHDFSIGKKTVEQNDRAGGRTGARFVDVGRHIASASGGENCMDFVRLSAGKKKADEA